MSDVTWYRLSERAPTEADADERGHVLWCRENNTPVAVGLNAGWPESDTVYWRRLTAADYPPKPREPRKLAWFLHWPPPESSRPPVLRLTWEAAEDLRVLYGGHIQRVEITEELP